MVLVLATLILYILLPFALVTFLILSVIRLMVRTGAKLMRPDLFRMLDANDSIFTTDEIHICPRNTIVTTLVLKEGTMVDTIQIRNTLKVNLLDARNPQNHKFLYPELQCNIDHWMGFPFLVMVPVPDNYSVYEYDNGSEATSQSELHLLKAKLTFQPFPKTGPLWELVVVPKVLNQEGSYYPVIIVRLHHSLTDGFGTLGLFQKLLDEPLIQISPINVGVTRYGPRNPFRYFGGPYDFAKYLHQSSTSTGHFVSKVDEKTIEPVTHSFNPSCPDGCAAELHFAESGSIPFSRIRAIGRKHGVTGTAVLHSAIAGAISSTLFKKKRIATPGTVLLRTMLPLPWPRRRLLGNHVSVGFYSVDLSEEDGLKRLKLIQESLSALKTSTFPCVMGLVVQFIGVLPTLLQGALFKSMGQSDNVIYVTSVPGPKEGIRFCGIDVIEVSSIAGWVLGINGPWVIFMTIGDQLNVGLFGNGDVFHNGEELEVIREFVRELDTLENRAPFNKELISYREP